jgi:tetratricopeptide (TPR) repeat protein
MRLAIITILIALLLCLAAAAQSRPQSAATLFEEGQNAQEKGDFSAAVNAYTRAIKIEPALYQLYYQRATSYLALGRTTEAEADLQKTIELKPDFSRAHRALGQILLDADKTAEAKREFARALELDAKLTGVRVLYAGALIKTNENAAAIEQLRTALEQGEKTAQIYALLGLGEERSNQLDDALAAYSQAIQMDSANATALEGRARLYEKRGILDKAIADYSAAYKSQPSRDVAFHLASLHSRAGQAQTAMRIYRALLAEKPDDIPVRLELLRLMIANEQADEAVKEVDKILTLYPKNIELLILAGDASFADKPELAAQYYQRALQIDSANNRARVQLGAALVRSKQFQAALPILNEALTAEPNNYTAHANRGTVLFKLEQYPDAAREFLWLVNAKPEIAASYYFLAISFDKLGGCEEAMKAYNEFVRRADAKVNSEEINDANIRLSLLQKLVKEKKCKSALKGKSN